MLVICWGDSEEHALVVSFVGGGSQEFVSVRRKFPCEVRWRPEALDCKVLIPPQTWPFYENPLKTVTDVSTAVKKRRLGNPHGPTDRAHPRDGCRCFVKYGKDR